MWDIPSGLCVTRAWLSLIGSVSDGALSATPFVLPEVASLAHGRAWPWSRLNDSKVIQKCCLLKNLFIHSEGFRVSGFRVSGFRASLEPLALEFHIMHGISYGISYNL